MTTRATPQTQLTRGTLIAGCLAVALAQIGIATPAVLNGLFQADPVLSPNASELTWISTAFNLAVTILELNFGVMGDLFGRKRLLIIGALAMAVGELLGGTAPFIGMLFVGQAVSGIGAGMLFPSSLSTLAARTHTSHDRARAISVWAACLSLGGFIAPLIAGITGSFGSWRWALIAVSAIAVISIIVTSLWAQESSSPEGRSLDWPGQFTILIALFALIFAVVQGPNDGWGNFRVVGAFVVGAVFLGLFVWIEQRTAKPMLRVSIFANRAFAVAAIVAVAGMFAFLGTAYTTSIRIGAIQGQSPLWTAYAFLLLNGVNFVLAVPVGRLLSRIEAKWVLAMGLAGIAIGDFWAMLVPIENSSPWPMTPPLLFVGLGFLFVVASITVVAVNAVPPHLTGMASATTSLLRDFGMTLGPAIGAAIALNRSAAAVRDEISGSSLSTHQKDASLELLHHAGPLALREAPRGSAAGAAHDLAVLALGHGYAIGYLACGIAALAAALLTVTSLHGKKAQLETVGIAEEESSNGSVE